MASGDGAVVGRGGERILIARVGSAHVGASLLSRDVRRWHRRRYRRVTCDGIAVVSAATSEFLSADIASAHVGASCDRVAYGGGAVVSAGGAWFPP